MNERITSKEILEKFIQKNGLSEEQSSNFIDAFQEIFLQAIEKDKTVKISGLGTFQLIWNKPRKSVDVRTQQEIEIAGHYKLTFIPENALKERVNAEFAHLEPQEIVLPQAKKESPIEKLSAQAKELKEILVDIQQDNKKETTEFEDEFKEKEVVKVEEKEKISTVVEEKVDEIIAVDEKIEEKVDDIIEIIEIIETPEIQEVKDIVVEETIIIEPDVEPIIEEKIIVEEQKIEEEIVVEPIIEEKEIVVVEETAEETIEEKQEEKIEEQPSEQPAETEVVLDEKELAQKQSAIDFFYQKPEPPIEVKANTFDYIENFEFEPKKRRCWLVWLIIFVVIAALVTAFYFVFPNLAKKYWNSTTQTATELTQKVGNWFSDSQYEEILPDTLVVAADTVKAETVETILDTAVEQPAEMPHTSIFDAPRNYTEFITSVTLSSGNTLVKLSQKYYGNKVFWVYIYEANREKIGDPNQILAGITVKIPKLNENLINSQDAACIEYAKELHNKYVKR